MEGQAWDSQKQRQFVESGLMDPVTREPKPIEALTGRLTALRLRDLGIRHAHQLVGHYMLHGRDDEGLDHWLQDECGVQRADLRESIIGTIRKWCEAHL